MAGKVLGFDCLQLEEELDWRSLVLVFGFTKVRKWLCLSCMYFLNIHVYNITLWNRSGGGALVLHPVISEK